MRDSSPSQRDPAEPIRAESLLDISNIRYSICTLVTRPQQYEAMRNSLRRAGFDGPDCEFLYLDNSQSNNFDAYTGCNLFLGVARGRYIVLCHQDILLEFDGRHKLDAILADLDRLDPDWALCGNSGGVGPGQLAIRISDPHGENQRYGPVPARVLSLDENFIVVRRQANLGLSRDLSGFHLYGADLCLNADIRGFSAYVVDFHLRHLSPGNRDASLAAARTAFINKYSRRFRSRWMQTPCELFYLSGNPLLAWFMSTRYVSRVAAKAGYYWSARKNAKVKS